MSGRNAGDKLSDSNKNGEVLPFQRKRWTPELPPPPTDLEVPWSRRRTELADYTDAQITSDLLGSDAWQQVMVPILDLIELERARPGMEAPLYSSHELESALLYQRVCGLLTYKEARQRLGGDEPDGVTARVLLGFDRPRNFDRKRGKKAQPVERFDGIPSESSVSRHKTRFGEERRAEAYEALFAAFREEHLQWDEYREELRELAIDGTRLLTHYTCPIVDPETGEVTNADSVTCPDGGYVAWSAGPEKWGHGWKPVILASHTAVPLCYSVPKMNCGESVEAAQLIEGDFADNVWPHLQGQISVLNGDANFTSPHLRSACRKYGILENIQAVSHKKEAFSSKKKQTAKSNAERANEKVYLIEGYPNWRANGHRELTCRCGRRPAKRIRLRPDGSVTSRLEGRCPKCGSITITSGDWRIAKNPDRLVRCMPNEPIEARDWAFGNPLTFNNPEAAAHGKARFHHNEGFFGALSTRFGLIADKRWLRSRAQARTDIAMVFSIIHAITLEQRRRKCAAEEAEPPPLALAA